MRQSWVRGCFHHGRDHRYPINENRPWRRFYSRRHSVLSFPCTSWWNFEDGQNRYARMRKDGCTNWQLIRQVYLFIPSSYLIFALFHGYFGIRAVAGTPLRPLFSWLSAEQDGHSGILQGAGLAGIMAIQIIVVCACRRCDRRVISLNRCGFALFLAAAGGGRCQPVPGAVSLPC